MKTWVHYLDHQYLVPNSQNQCKCVSFLIRPNLYVDLFVGPEIIQLNFTIIQCLPSYNSVCSKGMASYYSVCSKGMASYNSVCSKGMSHYNIVCSKGMPR